MTASCPVCHAQQDAGLLCSACCDVLERELGDVAAIVAELDITLSKQARIGGQQGKSGLARERIPINVGAMQAADNLGNVLTTWARDVSAENWEPHWSRRSPVIAASMSLLRSIPAIRRHPAVEELVDEITDAVAQARRAVDRPADRMFVGPCMGVTPDEQGRDVTCLEDLYARPTAGTVQCKVCGIEHDVAERRAWLLEQARDRLFTVREAAQMVGHVGGITVTESRIRGYIFRASNALNYRPGTKLIRLGDLLAVVLDESERKGAA